MKHTASKPKRERARKIIRELKKLISNPEMELTYKNNWELLVAVILSAQCTDKQVNKVTKKLFKKYRTLDDYVRAKPREFEKDIYSTGFYRNKTKHILAAARILKKDYGGKLPRTMAEMTRLPGVSRKTANVVLGNAYGIVEGIAVDTHVARIAKRFGLTTHTDPKKIEQDLMLIIPKSEWFVLTYLLIDYGRKYCSARTHDHKKCPLVRYDMKND